LGVRIPSKLSEIRDGCYNIHERIRDMNANGVAAALNFPSYPQFCGQYFARAHDKDLGLAVLQAALTHQKCARSPLRCLI
jgi:hypothetical protein